MSQALGTIPVPMAPAVPDQPLAKPPRRGPRLGLWGRVALIVLILTASASARTWRSWQVDEIQRSGRTAPFDLEKLPMKFGPWEGMKTTLDEEIARMTGAVQLVTRRYTHKITGQTLDMIFLFGPSTEVQGHSPTVCYPSNGFDCAEGPIPKTVSAPGAKSWPLYSAIYTKGNASRIEPREVYWTWFYSGKWNPSLASYREFERTPGMFKVHVDRAVRSEAEMSHREIGNPCEAFLARALPEIDRMIADAAAPRPTQAKSPR